MSTSPNPRSADHQIDPIFLNRWSPRAFTGEAISEQTLQTMFEAARWAPSSYNSQPWRFIYAHRDSAHWDKFFGLLNEYNQAWAKTASVLVFLVSSETMPSPAGNGVIPAPHHSFDAGAAWMSLALQATSMGLAAHAMALFDAERAYSELNVPSGYKIDVAIAIGRKGPTAQLSEALQTREVPNGRKPMTGFVSEGTF